MITTKVGGFLAINKPIGASSFKMVHLLRQVTGIKKIGHCGTLDPFAEGLLILAMGREFTKQISHFQDLGKQYRFTCELGIETDTLDPTGTQTKIDENFVMPNKDVIENILKKFLGEQSQIPPQYSAKKKDGQRAYKVARQGGEVELDPQQIVIDNIELLSIKENHLEICINCSKGTYVRSLCRDIAKALGTVGHASSLVREQIGDYDLSGALGVDQLSPENIKQAQFMLQ